MVCYMCVYCYYVIIIFYYKVNDSREKKKLVIVQTFDWLSRHMVYYLYMVECDCVDQQLIQCQCVEFSHLV